ncbi:MAG: DNA polymerase III subunit beta [Deltaproteobacteria bacterium]|nr:DNA polymerase III subunit beta [Deltaproteobacteria bacterium]
MNLSVPKEALSQLLYLASTIVERRTTMPILANVKLTADNGKLAIAATDLEISLAGEVAATIKTPGSITIGGKVLYEIARELPGETVSLHAQKAQRLEIESGQSRFKINGISADEYPAVQGVTLRKKTAVDAQKLYEMFKKTAFCVSTDETRYNINGVYVEGSNPNAKGEKGQIRFVATDGHRLAMIDRPAEGLEIQDQVIIPRKGLQELMKVLENNDGVAYVDSYEGFFIVESGSVTMGVRLVDGQFPDYRQVIPLETTTTIEVPREELLAAVRRVSLVTTDKSRTIKFKLVAGNLVVSSQSPEHGEASESLVVNQTGNEVTIGFSAKYVQDLLVAMEESETVTLRLSGDLGAGVFTGSADDLYTCIVMPMRFE